MQLANRFRQVRLVDNRNDPRVVNHLLEDDDVVLTLEDLEVAVVARPYPRHAITDAPLAQGRSV